MWTYILYLYTVYMQDQIILKASLGCILVILKLGALKLCKSL